MFCLCSEGFIFKLLFLDLQSALNPDEESRMSLLFFETANVLQHGELRRNDLYRQQYDLLKPIVFSSFLTEISGKLGNRF